MQLTQEQYWKWRFFASELSATKATTQATKLTLALQQKDIEISRLLSDKYKNTQVTQAIAEEKQAMTNYEEFRKELETALGRSLTNCTIDDISLEVKEIENL